MTQDMMHVWILSLCVWTTVLVFVLGKDENSQSSINLWWNSSNPMFMTGGAKLKVVIYTTLDIICPYTPDTTEYEYFTLYMVSEEGFRDCVFAEGSIPVVICSTPDRPKRYTLLFEPFSSLPDIMEFSYNKSYYVATFSSESKDDLNTDRRLCSEQNMKLNLTVVP
ncbi:ephrin-B2-like [Mercenaria mercenaria]|uniref:ephrin-B2-like n=1 Tax=Mercenaria mercenaria TaxID=6596 RepID=UPI00234F357E|nr:ephrin-B2-like [Mercenaria mercenaria]